MTINITNKLFIELDTEWRHLFRKTNWKTFTFIRAYVEAGFIGGYEIHLSLLGFSFYCRYNTDKSLEQFDEWDREPKGEAVSFEEFKKELVDHYSDTWTALKDK